MRGSLSLNQPLIRNAINSYFLRASGKEHRFRIMSPYKLFPEARQLESQFDQIKTEVTELIARRNLPQYRDIDPVRAAEVSDDWRLYYAYMLGVPNPKAYQDCPTIVSFAERTPCVVNAFISILEPGVKLNAHNGPYAGILRYHLALKVPSTNPPRLRVDTEYHTWRERESVLIDDTFEHEVSNESDEDRIVLIIDIRRPMGFLRDKVNQASLRMKRKWSDQFIGRTNGDI
ncbi:aspartyl/asparaginyl beta-hydroxylase domain-containing protein [Nocardia arthritidis]|uniref:Aspartyl/asparaginyl beta-hydroxylase domain-containing protein n=1 Tax=Nocardia arthritidis TaxID=228602 RepID=A0A6G9YHC9_9NOCA|nr:aspartyl/asparaginyl beta-hydroxylase domain-containing protein [Nocardia arthritidis]QIS12649.1 aspartyl/asparaginyl beta-hydroxylase domain-containing protein [Nocardia arthritidis]